MSPRSLLYFGVCNFKDIKRSLTLTFNVIQGRLFSSHLEGRMPLPVLLIILTLAKSLTVSEIWLGFSLKTHILTFSFSPKFENVPLALHPQILYSESLETGLIIRTKSSLIIPTN